MIVGGTAVSDETFARDWPFAAFLALPGNEWCTATVIGPRWVMTAAHCVSDLAGDPGPGTAAVGVGSTDFNTSRFIGVVGVHVHPEYDPGLFSPAHDVALLQLAADADVAPAALPFADVVPGERVAIAGWGLTPFALPLVLQSATLTVDRVFASHFEAASPVSSSCSGDSGGPVISASWAVVGVTSIGQAGCPRGSPASYTSVFGHLDWITATTGIVPFLPDRQPPVVSVAVAPVAVSSAATLIATIDDRGTGGSAIRSAAVHFPADAAPQPMTAADGTFDEPLEEARTTLTAPGEIGIYPICVEATDAALQAAAPVCTDLVVYDPSSGFVTGAGWFTSQWNSVVGKAHFSIVARYEPRAASPRGAVRFSLPTGLDLRSTSFDWLLISPSGGLASMRGTGTIGGLAGEYEFSLSVSDDAGGDALFLDIREKGTGALVYAHTGTIGGGNIVLHTGGPGRR